MPSARSDWVAHGVDHRVVALGQVLGIDVASDGDVAEEPEPGVGGRLLEGPADRFDLGVVRRNTRTDQPPRSGQHFEHVDLHVSAAPADRFVGEPQQGGSREVSGRAGADDSDVVRAHAGMVITAVPGR